MENEMEKFGLTSIMNGNLSKRTNLNIIQEKGEGYGGSKKLWTF